MVLLYLTEQNYVIIFFMQITTIKMIEIKLSVMNEVSILLWMKDDNDDDNINVWDW